MLGVGLLTPEKGEAFGYKIVALIVNYRPIASPGKGEAFGYKIVALIVNYRPNASPLQLKSIFPIPHSLLPTA